MPFWKGRRSSNPRPSGKLLKDGSRRLELLHSAIQPDERIATETQGKQSLGGGLEDDARIIVTNKRLIWILGHGPLLVQDVAFEDVIACLTDEEEMRFMLEADEPRYRELFDHKTTLLAMRLGPFGDPVGILRLIESLVPPAALSRLPNLEG